MLVVCILGARTVIFFAKSKHRRPDEPLEWDVCHVAALAEPSLTLNSGLQAMPSPRYW